VLIGDGLVDPLNQFNNYDSYLNAAGIISNEWRDTVSFMQNEAITRMMRGDLKEASGYINFIIDDEDIAKKYYAGMSIVNYKQYDEGNINPEYGNYIQDKKKNFGVPDWLNYNDDNEKMYDDFAADISTSFKRELERILTLGVKTLIYNGQNDVIINTPGTLAYLNSLEWTNSKQWKAAPKKTWSEYGSTNLGWYKRYGNLNFVLVRNAGHLVPADQPQSAWRMLNRYFLSGW
jgi:carboxypeptidase C (cathepsin A)